MDPITCLGRSVVAYARVLRVLGASRYHGYVELRSNNFSYAGEVVMFAHIFSFIAVREVASVGFRLEEARERGLGYHTQTLSSSQPYRTAGFFASLHLRTHGLASSSPRTGIGCFGMAPQDRSWLLRSRTKALVVRAWNTRTEVGFFVTMHRHGLLDHGTPGERLASSSPCRGNCVFVILLFAGYLPPLRGPGFAEAGDFVYHYVSAVARSITADRFDFTSTNV